MVGRAGPTCATLDGHAVIVIDSRAEDMAALRLAMPPNYRLGLQTATVLYIFRRKLRIGRGECSVILVFSIRLQEKRPSTV